MPLSADEEAQRVLFCLYNPQTQQRAHMDTHRPTDTEEPIELTPALREQNIQQCKALLKKTQTKKEQTPSYL